MSGPSFNGLGPFQDGLTIAERGRRALILSDVTKLDRSVQPARQALGAPHNPERLALALKLFNELPPLTKRHILASYGKKAFRDERGAA